MKTQAADQRAKDDQEVLSAYRAFEETELLNVRPFFWRENEKPRRVRSAAHTDKGVSVMLSNSDVPEIRELYEGFEIKIIQARRAVNSKGDGRGPVNEVLVLGAGMRETQAPIDLLYELPQEGV